MKQETDDYSASGFFVLRAPLMPIEEFLQLSSPLNSGLQSHVQANYDRISPRACLHQWVQRPEVAEALWIASPELLESLALWWDNPESPKGEKLEQALYRYFARMTARATPFGAFASCSLGEIAEDTHLELAPLAQCRRRTRLDMEYLCNFTESISADPAHRSHICFRPNSTLHLVAAKYHHVRCDWEQGERLYRLIATDRLPALETILSRAVSGATAHTLASSLVEDDPEIPLEEAEDFIGCLIDSQLLVSDLAPPVTGADLVQHVLGRLEAAQLPGVAAAPRSAVAGVGALDHGGLGENLQAYTEIADTVSKLGGEFRPGRLIQVDVARPVVAASLDKRLVNDILHAIGVLHSIHADTFQPALQRFKDDYQERYQDREVPLLEALDDEAGIGFEGEDNPTAEPLVAGIDFHPAGILEVAGAPEAGPLLLRRLEECRANKRAVLELDSELLQELTVNAPLALPDSFAALGVVFRMPDGKQGFSLQTVSGPSGANLLARFCHTDERLTECIREHLHAEEALHLDGAIFAEIAHLPEGRVGNVVCRPILRQYEIPFLATSVLPPERQIALSDLTVSVQGRRIVLRSRRLGCEVIPRLTTAHDFTASRNLKLYKFLGLLQGQGVTSDLSWNWGVLQSAEFLPRVALGNVVFSLARWIVTREVARGLCQGRGVERYRRVQQWRTANSLPRFVRIAESDNQLLIDLENALSVDTFLEHIRKSSDTFLMEVFPSPDALPVRGPEGSFVHEIVLPFTRVRRGPVVASQETIAPSTASLPMSSPVHGLGLIPGSEWLFAKLYCSPSHADRLLLELVQPLVESVFEAGTADGWFFTRYADPQWHLRLRFHGDGAVLRNRVVPELSRRAEEHERVETLWRLQWDEYEREVERYGGPNGIGIAEQFFQLDSELCLGLLALISGDAGAQLRWQLAFCGVHHVLDAMGFSLKEKKVLAANMREFREREFLGGATYRRQLARKFRDERHTLAAILQDADGIVQPPTVLPREAAAAFARFSAGLRAIRKQLQDPADSGALTKTIPELTADFVHMHLNRMLRSSHHAQETVLYDFLARTYAAKIVKEKSTQ